MALKNKFNGPTGRIYHPRQRKLRTTGEAIGSVISALDGTNNMAMPKLWKAWPELMGPDLSEMAKPLGHRKRTLILAADDPVVVQELSYFAQEIVERVNSFLGQEVFDKILFELLNGRVPLDGYELKRPEFNDPELKKPRKLGGLKDKFDPDQPVGRCYLKYLRLFEES
jgi:hypothetical protein